MYILVVPLVTTEETDTFLSFGGMNSIIVQV